HQREGRLHHPAHAHVLLRHGGPAALLDRGGQGPRRPPDRRGARDRRPLLPEALRAAHPRTAQARGHGLPGQPQQQVDPRHVRPRPVAGARRAAQGRPDGRGAQGVRGVHQRARHEEVAFARFVPERGGPRMTATGTLRARARRTLLGLHRHRARRAPLDPDLAVLAAYWNRGVACNPAAIAAELARRAPHVRPVWVVNRAAVPRLPPGTDHVVPGTRRHAEVLARATWFVNNVNFPNALVKRPGTVHLQTHHGTPLKTMGLDQ
ncbi:CDP-glycerol--poly(glycerophosphate) glycerophosphotransferase, partial [Streptomyces sp. SID5785]|nr:CDP-glycerol--poly(glycerophosphate) glycerophosphotransferase [Streptomyces sp. SID5785]